MNRMNGLSQRRVGAHATGYLGAVAEIGGVAVLWAFILVAAVSLAGAMVRYRRADQEDFAVYYFLAQAMREGRNPYVLDLGKMARGGGANLHDISRGSDPPAFLLLFEPLTALPLNTAYWVWQVINVACLAAALFLLLGDVSGSEPVWAAALAGLAILYPPVGVHLWMGQSKLPLLLLLALAIRWMGRGCEAGAGLALASAALLRIFPIVLIGYPIVQRRWRIAIYAMVGLLVGGTITTMLAGIAGTRSFVSSLSFLTGRWWENDIASRAFVARVLWTADPSPSIGPKIARYAIVGTADLAAAALTLRATLMYGERSDPGWRVFSLWIATSLFLLPVAWDYDLVLMLIPFAQLARASARGEASCRAIAAASLSYLFILLWECVGRVPPSAAALRATAGEAGFLSLSAGWLAAYWFAVDGRDALALPIGGLPTRLLGRLTPAARPSAALDSRPARGL